MKVLHIESGLGNQMLDYADYLAIKKSNPEDDCYIETLVYDIKEANDAICMWNGYELKNVFGIDAPNIQLKFSDEQWKAIINDLHESKFWTNWCYSEAICSAFSKQGLKLIPTDTGAHLYQGNGKSFSKTFLGYHIKRVISPIFKERYVREQNLFITSEENLLTGHTLRFNQKLSGIEKIDKEIRDAFKFPAISDEYNLNILKQIHSSNSVAIHARRGDMLCRNGQYYKYGYFKRAVKFIKKNVVHPVFFFFCDNGSMDWVKGNLNIFGLDKNIDHICFVTENTGLNSFRDMQLIAECKHAVITNSSFGFWGAYLNTNKNKITCSPCIELNTTHFF